MGPRMSAESGPWDRTGGFGERFPLGGGGSLRTSDAEVNPVLNEAEESVGTQEKGV